MYVVHGSNNRDTHGNVLYVTEIHGLCEINNRYVILYKQSFLLSLKTVQGEQR